MLVDSTPLTVSLFWLKSQTILVPAAPWLDGRKSSSLKSRSIITEIGEPTESSATKARLLLPLMKLSIAALAVAEPASATAAASSLSCEFIG